MALEIRHLPKEQPMGLTADRKIWLTEGRDRIAEDGSTEAAILLAPAGALITSEWVERLGLELKDGKVVQTSATATAPAPQDPAAPAPAAGPAAPPAAAADSPADGSPPGDQE